MFKFILFFILFYFIFRFLKGVFSNNSSGSLHNNMNFQGIQKQTSEMVQDPVCKVYIPKSEAITTETAGITYYFCSKECLEKFKTDN